MDALIADFLQIVRRQSPCHTITETGIATGRSSLTVSPSISAPLVKELVLMTPLDNEEETQLCLALLSLLSKASDPKSLLARARAALHAGQRHEEILPHWRVHFRDFAGRKTLRAERISGTVSARSN